MAKNIVEIEAIIGAKPSPTSLSFKQWILNYTNYRTEVEAPLNLPNQINYYFSAAGSDTNDGLSPASPKTSITGCQVLIASLNKSGNYGFHFRAGDVFSWPGDSLALTFADISGVVVNSYRDSSTPSGVDYAIISAWRPLTDIVAAGSGWVSLGSNAYMIATATSASRPWWIKNGSGTHYILNTAPTGIYGEANSLAELNAMTGVFRWASNILYVKPHVTIHPSGLDIYVTQNDKGGILSSYCETYRCNKIVADGFGVGTVDDIYNHTALIKNRQLAVYTDCGGYYGGKHIIGTLQQQGGSNGGFSIFKGNHLGLMRYDSSGETAFIAYAIGGANEYVFLRNSGCAGTMPSGLAAMSPRGQNVYAHTNGVLSPTFGVAMENYTSWNRTQGFGTTNYLADFQTILAVSGGSLNACSGFLIDDVCDYDRETTVSALPHDGLCLINCTHFLKFTTSVRPIQRQIIGNGVVGKQRYYVNNEIFVRVASGSYFDQGIFGSFSDNTVENTDFHHCLLSISFDPGTTWSGKQMSIGYNFGKTATGSYHPNWNARNIRACNTVFSCYANTGSMINAVNLHNAPPNTSGIFGGMLSCAFYNFLSSGCANGNQRFFGHDLTPNYLTLTGHIPTGYRVSASHPLVNQTLNTWETAIEYDKLWHPRRNNVIGPYDYSDVGSPSGFRLSSRYSTVTGTIVTPIANDITAYIYRKADNQFGSGILIATCIYPNITGIVDERVKGDKNYTYTVLYVDSSNNATQNAVTIGLAGNAESSISTGSNNNIQTTTAGIHTNITDQSLSTSGIYNMVYEIITSKIIGIDGKIYNQAVTGVRYLPSYQGGPELGEPA